METKSKRTPELLIRINKSIGTNGRDLYKGEIVVTVRRSENCTTEMQLLSYSHEHKMLVRGELITRLQEFQKSVDQFLEELIAIDKENTKPFLEHYKALQQKELEQKEKRKGKKK